MGIPVALYIVSTLMIGAALAGIAGFGEVSAIQGQLRPDISPGYGYIGFLVIASRALSRAPAAAPMWYMPARLAVR